MSRQCWRKYDVCHKNHQNKQTQTAVKENTSQTLLRPFYLRLMCKVKAHLKAFKSIIISLCRFKRARHPAVFPPWSAVHKYLGRDSLRDLLSSGFQLYKHFLNRLRTAHDLIFVCHRAWELRTSSILLQQQTLSFEIMCAGTCVVLSTHITKWAGHIK